MRGYQFLRNTVKDKARERGFNSTVDMLNADVTQFDTATDPNIASAVLIMNFDGTQDSTSFVDAKGHTLTANGTVRHTAIYRKYGYMGGYFDAASHISTPNSADFNFGTGDFCIEFWAFRAAAGNIRCFASNYQNSANGWSLETVSATNVMSFNATGDGVDLSGSITIPVGKMFHGFVGRSGTTLVEGLNGVIGSTGTNSANITSTAGLNIGRLGTVSTDFFLGGIAGIRIYKGYFPYTTSGTYTVPPGRFPTA